MNDITVLTTTYNRCNNLEKAYNSLCKQGNVNFTWLIIDDGSIDDTKLFVKKWIAENKICIKYFYQENKGVTFARHFGRMLVETYWMTVLDSDDYYVDGALEDIINIIDEYNIEADRKCMGFLFPVSNDQTTNLKEGKYSITQQYYKFNCVGEFQAVVKTDEWNRFQPPRFIGEKFITESVYLRQIDRYYYYECINKRFMVRHYQEDGLTNNIASIIKQNPLGQAYAMKIDCVYGKDMGFMKQVQAYIDFRNYSTNSLQESKELFQELKVPVHVIGVANLFNKCKFFSYIKSKIQYPFPKNIIRKKSKVILWGAGNMGKALKLYNDIRRYCDIVLWVDINYAVKQGEGLNVKNPDKIFYVNEYDYILIAIQSPNACENIAQHMLKKGIDKRKIVRMSK